MGTGAEARHQRVLSERHGESCHAAAGFGYSGHGVKKKLDTEGHIALYINFDTDKATIRPESEPTVAEVLTLLQQNPKLRLAVQGHTDNAGTSQHNQQLSEARAAAVVASLSKAGIAATRLQAAGFGQTKPLADNATEEGKAKNRRVELVKL